MLLTLWLLHSFNPLFHNCPGALGGGSGMQMSHLQLSIAQTLGLRRPKLDYAHLVSYFLSVNAKCYTHSTYKENVLSNITQINN